MTSHALLAVVFLLTMSVPCATGLRPAIAQQRGSAPQKVAAATITSSCAPWDGEAFAIRVPASDERSAPIVTVEIWVAPRLDRPTTFRFPDREGRTGVAFLVTGSDTTAELAGLVAVDRVELSTPATGTLRLITKDGRRIERAFRAIWGTSREFCGG